jgi:hypothetical integral membrane protein (TIGR02206 family)
VQSGFRLFGPIHLFILASVFGVAAGLVALHRSVERGRTVRLTVAAVLILVAVVWYGYLVHRGWLQFPEALPLELCDATLALTVLALLTLRPLVYDIAYYGALAGTGMALLTPDLWEPFPSFSTVHFFVAHGLVVSAVLYLLWTGQARPRPRSVWKAWAAVNVYAAIVAGFNLAFGTNYMYLMSKPESASLLDYLGPWPLYLLTVQAVALALFGLLYLPFRRGGPGTRAPEKESM